MKILVSGGTGLVGRAIIPILQSRGHQVANLTTRKELDSTWENGLRHSYWNPALREIKANEIEWADAVINLAGFSVANRWTQGNKDRMICSRIDATDLLVKSILASASPPSVFLSASASGYYNSSPEWQDESAPNGSGFLADLCRNWEECSLPLEATSVRRVIVRIGVVLDAKEAALGQMIPLFQKGLGASVGGGKQWMSWIHIEDLAQAIVHCIETEDAKGVYNVVAPEPTTNEEFSKALASVLKKPFFLPSVPAFALKLLFGEMGSMVLASQRLNSTRLLKSGFGFRHPSLQEALNNLLK